MNPLLGLISVLIANPIVRALETIWGRIAAAGLILLVAFLVAFSVPDKPYQTYKSYAFLTSEDIFLLSVIIIPVMVGSMAYGGYVALRMYRKIPEEAYQRSLYDQMRWKVTLAGQSCRIARLSVYDTFWVLETVYRTYTISHDAMRSLKQPVSSLINRSLAVHILPNDPTVFPSIVLRGKKSASFYTALSRVLHKSPTARKR